MLDAPLKALNPPLVGGLLGVVVDGATGAKGDLAPPRADVDPKVGAVAVAFVGVFGELVRANADTGGGVSSGFLKNGDELGAPKLPKAPNPLAGLKEEGVDWSPLNTLGADEGAAEKAEKEGGGDLSGSGDDGGESSRSGLSLSLEPKGDGLDGAANGLVDELVAPKAPAGAKTDVRGAVSLIGVAGVAGVTGAANGDVAFAAGRLNGLVAFGPSLVTKGTEEKALNAFAVPETGLFSVAAGVELNGEGLLEANVLNPPCEVGLASVVLAADPNAEGVDEAKVPNPPCGAFLASEVLPADPKAEGVDEAKELNPPDIGAVIPAGFDC